MVRVEIVLKVLNVSWMAPLRRCVFVLRSFLRFFLRCRYFRRCSFVRRSFVRCSFLRCSFVAFRCSLSLFSSLFEAFRCLAMPCDAFSLPFDAFRCSIRFVVQCLSLFDALLFIFSLSVVRCLALPLSSVSLSIVLLSDLLLRCLALLPCVIFLASLPCVSCRLFVALVRSLVRWCVGALVRSLVRSLVRWCVGALVRRWWCFVV